MPEPAVGATLKIKDSAAAPIAVHFNPSSLQYTVQNQVVEQANGQAQGDQQRKQYITQTTAKLTMDLIFDTTDTGQNVCNLTVPIAQLMIPQTESNDQETRTAPPIVLFEWGDYAFEGMLEQYRETIDFFHPSGVPLRSSLNLTLASQTLQFEQGGSSASPTNNSARELPAGQNPQTLATQGGNPRAARAIASQNGQESLRFSRGPITVSASVQLKGPSGFASGGAGIGAGAGIGGGIGVGGGIGAGAGLSFGGSASAGVSASAGAFAGLGSSTSAGAKASYSLNTRNLLPSNGTAGLSLQAGAGIGAGAGLGASAGASLNAGGQASGSGAAVRVDLSANGRSRIIFSTGEE
jgi:hypothetical protein